MPRLICSSIVLLSLLAVGSTQAEEYRNRSLYVPVEFKLCEHLDNALLYRHDDSEILGRVPSRRIFQFTYYPDLRRVEPSVIQLRVEGERHDGSPFVGRLAVGPRGIYIGSKTIELDFARQLRLMKHKLDVRYKSTTLRFRCKDSCKLIADNRPAARDIRD